MAVGLQVTSHISSGRLPLLPARPAVYNILYMNRICSTYHVLTNICWVLHTLLASDIRLSNMKLTQLRRTSTRRAFVVKKCDFSCANVIWAPVGTTRGYCFHAGGSLTHVQIHNIAMLSSPTNAAVLTKLTDRYKFWFDKILLNSLNTPLILISIYIVNWKKHTKMYFVISSIKLGEF